MNDTIFVSLASKAERKRYKIFDDQRITGSKDLNDVEFVKRYINDNLSRQDLSFIYVTVKVDEEYEIYSSRFISFESEIHKNIWASNNYKKSLGVLNEMAYEILN